MIRELEIQNLRSIQKLKLEFTQGVNLIIGPNGSGKTSILESIGFFAFGRFLSAESDTLAIAHGCEVLRIVGQIQSEAGEERVEIAVGRKEKLVKLNDRKVSGSEIIGLMRAVSFTPQSVDLVSGSPSQRRREIDMVCAQSNHQYVTDLLHLRKILKERNSLLKEISQGRSKDEELDFWDKKLIEYSLKIYSRRHELLDFINQSVSSTFAQLLKREVDLELKYVPSCPYDRFEEYLVAHRDEDVRSGSTSIGPHRDDFEFITDGFSLRDGGSRGEQRMATVSFKSCARDYLKNSLDPIMILDDVFSELDEKRRAAVAEVFLKGSGQIFLSATDERVIPSSLIKKANIIRL